MVATVLEVAHASRALTAQSVLPIVSTRASRVRTSASRNNPLILEKASSMGLEVRRVGRQVEKLAASLLDQLTYPFAFG